MRAAWELFKQDTQREFPVGRLDTVRGTRRPILIGTFFFLTFKDHLNNIYLTFYVIIIIYLNPLLFFTFRFHFGYLHCNHSIVLFLSF